MYGVLYQSMYICTKYSVSQDVFELQSQQLETVPQQQTACSSTWHSFRLGGWGALAQHGTKPQVGLWPGGRATCASSQAPRKFASPHTWSTEYCMYVHRYLRYTFQTNLPTFFTSHESRLTTSQHVVVFFWCCGL